MSDFDFIEDYDFEEMRLFIVVTPAIEELELYEWLKENPDVPTTDVVAELQRLNQYCSLRQMSVSLLRELVRIDLSHCDRPSLQKAEAIRRMMDGESMSHSTGICESDTQGYGRLGCYGYWEFPIWEEDLTRAENDEDWCMRKGRLK